MQGKNNSILGLNISMIIIITILIWDVYIFFTKSGLAPKLFAAGSFVLFTILLFLFWQQNSKSSKEK